uniref:Si:dkey-117n7.5 n=1 Tax=Seriola lalandi dorsalis TaxID=1841481 RepID=A0A3B4YK99_SERLL
LSSSSLLPLVYLLCISKLLFFVSTDRCLEPMAEGACSEYILLWYFHPRSGECRPFVYGGCGGNRNRFSSRQECQSCQQPKIRCSFLYIIV